MTGSSTSQVSMRQSLTEDNREQVRLARAELLYLVEPEDSLISGAVQLFGARTVADSLSGRQKLTLDSLVQASGENITEEQGKHLLATLADRVARCKRRRPERSVHTELSAAQKIDAWLCIPEDPDWPLQLADLGSAEPLALWGRGDRNLLQSMTVTKSIAVVGSRDITSYGTSATTHLVGDLAAQGKTIISGGAFGIDAVAHRSALATAVSPLPTVAFMACGVDRPYPKHNEQLLLNIIDRGLLLSEVPLGFSPTRWRFLQRNRIIAASAATTVVVEARWRSGALNTAHHALEIGRNLRVVPGSIFSPNSEGCHRLVRDGLAEIVTGAQQIIDDCTSRFDANQQEMSLFGENQQNSEFPQLVNELQQRVWDSLPLRKYATVNSLSNMTGVDTRTLLVTLSQLMQQGVAEQDHSGWRKSKKYLHATPIN